MTNISKTPLTDALNFFTEDERLELWKQQDISDRQIATITSAVLAKLSVLPAAQPEHGDIRALKYRIHELEGEVIGYKRMLEEAALKKLADLGQEIKQEPICPECKAAVLYECVACSSNNYPTRTSADTKNTPAAAQRKPLTDDQMWVIWNAQGIDDMNQPEAIAFARAIEAAHGIKEGT